MCHSHSLEWLIEIFSWINLLAQQVHLSLSCLNLSYCINRECWDECYIVSTSTYSVCIKYIVHSTIQTYIQIIRVYEFCHVILEEILKFSEQSSFLFKQQMNPGTEDNNSMQIFIKFCFLFGSIYFEVCSVQSVRNIMVCIISRWIIDKIQLHFHVLINHRNTIITSINLIP